MFSRACVFYYTCEMSESMVGINKQEHEKHKHNDRGHFQRKGVFVFSLKSLTLTLKMLRAIVFVNVFPIYSSQPRTQEMSKYHPLKHTSTNKSRTNTET